MSVGVVRITEAAGRNAAKTRTFCAVEVEHVFVASKLSLIKAVLALIRVFPRVVLNMVLNESLETAGKDLRPEKRIQMAHSRNHCGLMILQIFLERT